MNNSPQLLVYKASAGSGKTFTLTVQYIKLLVSQVSSPTAYRNILAVTFTNKATDEMKSRILKELHIMASNPSESDYHDDFIPSLFPSDEKLQEKAKSVLQDILHDYSAFAVSTIDRFFQHTLKAFSREIGHFASYQVELDKNSLIAESVDRVLDSMTGEAKDKKKLKWLTDNTMAMLQKGVVVQANIWGKAATCLFVWQKRNTVFRTTRRCLARPKASRSQSVTLRSRQAQASSSPSQVI